MVVVVVVVGSAAAGAHAVLTLPYQRLQLDARSTSPVSPNVALGPAASRAAWTKLTLAPQERSASVPVLPGTRD